ncbi:RdgB/HAM1 family non-canonical purine NTP pyrophosphatase [Uliginosibacterium gangwonense]|uniref:RdgB/HAM1 family non-canonical purine NTP pyrophosphatase n=1 Tax=Uliginosibacterium gangwonense TaxID=392736 RepID=UPI00036857A6
MKEMKKLVMASNNVGKLREFQALLAPLGWEVIPQSELGVGEAEEPHCTFVENALAKARHAAQATGLPALADDSGICIHALGGAPGVQSARFAGEPKSDENNNALLLEKLQDATDRSAHYVCVLVMVHSADDPQPLIAEGEWHGEILREPRGSGGFGYDPLFWLADLGQSAAEIPAQLKNTLSHRGAACRHLLERLKAQA